MPDGGPLISLAGFRGLRSQFAFSGVVAEVLIVASILAAAFTYLDVPLGNALLIGIAVTLQAALGTVVLTCILSGVKGSLILLMGPGLIVGGALSFALFQIVGRGWIGLIATTVAGLVAMLRLVRSTPWQPLETRRLWLMSQILGLAALALTWEFGELLPVAIVLFALGFFISESSQFPSVVRWLVSGGTGGVIIVAFFLRQDYWWLVSGDYQILSIQASHITESGVLAKWGSHDWTRYHWLPTGWSGLLDEFGARPDTYTTLLKVMPLTYSTSFSASLILLLATISKRFQYRQADVLPLWVLVALNSLDWSAPSTGGSLAAVAASAGLIVIALETSQTATKRILLYGLCLPIVALTKFPAVFTTILLMMASEGLRIPKVAGQKIIRCSLLIVGISSFTLVPVLYLTSTLVGGFSIRTKNPMLGSISEFGPATAIGLTLFTRTLHILLVTLVLISLVKMSRTLVPSKTESLIFSSSLFILLGSFADVFISPVNSNGHQYFSAPLYLIGTIPILFLSEKTTQEKLAPKHRVTLLLVMLIGVAALSSASYTTNLLVQNFSMFQLADHRLTSFSQFFLADNRTGAALAVFTLLLFAWRSRFASNSSVVNTLLFGVILLTALNTLPHSTREFKHVRTSSEVEASLGSTNLRSIGDWLRLNTNRGELIATNYLRDSEGELLSDYSLAVWAERTFFVLGPRFFAESKSQQRAVSVSESFAESPTITDAKLLWTAGVRWFIVDQRLTNLRDWEPFAKKVKEISSFSVLQMHTPDSD